MTTPATLAADAATRAAMADGNPLDPTKPMAIINAKLQGFWEGLIAQTPNIIAGLILLIIVWFASKWVARAVRAAANRRKRPDLGVLLGSLARGALIVLGVLIAATIIFPTVNPGDVFASLGVGTVAIGFAFKDILQNLLAGLLLLIRRPYRRGDQIVVKDYEGTVEHIESRATLIKTYDGRRVIIPNSDVYTSPVVVLTAFETRRDEYDVGIGYGDDLAAACAAFVEAVQAVDGVVPDPRVEALPWGLDANWVTVRVRWWVKSLRTDVVHTRAKVIRAIQRAAGEHRIDLPFPTNVVLFHNQTEEGDGDRSRQREGWPGESKARPIAGPVAGSEGEGKK